MRGLRASILAKHERGRFTEDDRIEIYTSLKAGESQAAISRALGFDTSTISRELRRNSGNRGYRAKQAHRLCQERRAVIRRKRISRSQWRIVEAGLRQDWNPEQIHGVMRLKGLSPVSHERIYHHVYADKRRGGALYTHLPYQTQRRKRRGVFNRRGQIKDRICKRSALSSWRPERAMEIERSIRLSGTRRKPR